MCKELDLTGERFGKLIAIKKAEPIIEPSGKRRTRWLCRCDCGKYHEVFTDSLRSGHTTSCGCTKHGFSSERLYEIWNSMKSRCYNENNKRYKNYGGRGIKVCDIWLHDYVAFRTWMLENGYDPDAKYGETTIDRIDVNGDYCPENCRVVNMKTQEANKTNTVKYTFQGKTKTILEWAEQYGLDPKTLRARIDVYHWDVEKALLTPVEKMYTYQGETKSLSAWAKEYGLNRKTLWQRIYRYKWDMKTALLTPIIKKEV